MSAGILAGLFLDEPFVFPPDQRPALAGSPARPPHPPGRRVIYGVVGVLVSITSGFGAALVASNTIYLLGPLGATASEAAWLSTVYIMTYVSMNLVIVKARQQFGLRPFAMAGLILFCLVTAGRQLADTLGGAIAVQALAGVATAPLLAFGTYYCTAAMRPTRALNGTVLAVSLSQLPTPLSRLVPTDTLDVDQWSQFSDVGLGLALLSLVAIAIVRLPPSEKVRVFEPLDLASGLLFAIGMALLVAVIGMGRTEWWTDRLWLGWALAGSGPLIVAALVIEYHRARPLIDLRFLGRAHLMRFGFVMIVLRVVLAEQSTLAFGLLGTSGIITLDLRLFSAVLTAASLAGAAAATWIFQPGRLTAIAGTAFAMIAIAALIDSDATSLTRAPQLYATQMAISFATSFAVGPAMLYGLGRVMKAGGPTLVSFMVLFTITQNVGNLLGGGLLGTYQVFDMARASVALIARAPDFDPAVLARLHNLGGGAAANSLLQSELRSQASVIAFDNGFAWVAPIAGVAALYMFARMVIDLRATRAPA